MKKSIITRLTSIYLLLAVGLAAGHAALLNWDPGLTGGAGGGGTGTWDLNTTANWFNGTADAKWTDNSAAGTDQAIFGGTSVSSTVTLSTSLSASNLQFTATGYTLSGAGTLTLGAGGLDATAVSSGTTTIGTSLLLPAAQQAWQAGAGGTLAINGAVTRSTGASVDFSATGITTTSPSLTNDAGGILDGWATSGDYITSSTTGDFLSVSNGNVVISTNYLAVSASASSTPSTASIAGQNLVSGQLNGANFITTIAGSVAINSLVAQGDFSVNDGITVTVNSGGLILRGTSRWVLDAGGGNLGTAVLESGLASGELFVHTPNSTATDWRIWPQIHDNGATPGIVVKDGPGVVNLQNANSYSGGTIINNGILTSGRDNSLTNPGTVGFGTVTVKNGAILEIGFGTANANVDYFVTNSLAISGGSALSDDGHQHLTGPITIGAAGATLGSTYDGAGNATTGNKALFIDGLVSGSGPITLQQSMTAGAADRYGNGTGNPYNSSVVEFGNNANTYSGTITVVPYTTGAGSYVVVNGSTALQYATVDVETNSGASQRFAGTSLIFNTGLGSASLGGLTGACGIILNGFNENTYALQTDAIALSVGNNNSSTTFSGGINGSGSLTKLGTGTLTLSGTNGYAGNTAINGGSLVLSGSWVNSTNITAASGTTLDVSALGTVTLAGYQVLASGGTVAGSLSANSGSQIYVGTVGGYETNAITGSLALASGVPVYMDVGTVHNGSNDLLTVAGTLTANNNVVHLRASSASVNLDSTADYVLISSPNPISGSFASAPSWDIAPANAAHYRIVTGANTVTLHYVSFTAPTAGGSASPSTAVRNQNVSVSITATNGSGGTVNSVTVDASQIGGSSTLALAEASSSGSVSVWTNTVVVTPGTGAGNKTLTATVSDTASLSSAVGLPLTVTVGNDVWNGNGGNANFSTGLNWTNHLAPGYAGDSLEFAGTTQLAPNMDNSYAITSVLFDSGAGSFTIGTANSSALTLSGSFVNNSANPETLNVPITFPGAQTINAAAGNIALGGLITGSSSLTKTGAGTLSLNATGNSFTGNLTVIGGALNVGGSTTFGTGLSYVGYEANSGNLAISGGNFSSGEIWVGGSDLSGTAYNAAGTLTVSGGANVSLGKLAIAHGNNSQNTASGTVTVNSGTLSSENDILMGFAGGGAAKLVLNSGTLNDASTIKRWVIVGQYDNTTSELDVNGGQMNVNANTDIRFSIGNNTSTNTVNLNGGAITFYSDNATTVGGSGVVDLHQGTGATAVDTFNLNGGTLTVPGGVMSANTAGTRTFNFNGGTLKASAANITFMSLGTGNAVANVRNGGAVIDDGGFGIEVDQALLHSTIAGDSAADGGLTKQGAGTLTLGGVDTYTGNTAVNAGTLTLSASGSISNSPNIIVGTGATFDVSASGSFTLGGSQALLGSGTNNGPILTSAGSKIYAGTDGTYGTNTFNNTLTLVSGTACYFDLGTVYNGSNDLMVVNGALTANGNAIHIKAPSTSSVFDSTADYVLISSTSAISGTFAVTPVWDLPPANAGHYTVVTSGNTAVLHYNAIAAPVVTASAQPATVLRNQPTVITANVTPGSSAISSVTVDLTPLGGSVVSLVQSNTSTLYTNSATVPATMNAGSVSLTVTAMDTSSHSGSASVSITISTSTEVWNGGGSGNWSANADWASGYAPGYAGDAVLFAGPAGLTPNVDNNYSVTGLSFSNNASSFTIGTGDNSALTLTANGIVNNSANAQTVNVPVTMTAPETINAASGNIALGSGVTNNAGLLSVAGAGNTAISGVISGVGLTKTGSGTLTLNAAGNSFSGNLTAIGGGLNITGGSTTFGNNLSYAGYDANSGNLSVSGGSFTNGGDFWVGGSDQNGPANVAAGTLTVSGGANVSLGKLSVARGNWFDNTVSGIVTINNSSVSSENDLLIGFAGAANGKVILNSGTFNEASTTKRWVILSQWDTANSEIDVNGGQMNVNANTDIRFAISGNNGTNTFNLNGGAVTFYSDDATTVGGSGVVDLHQGTGSTVVNTFNLNGGTLTVPGGVTSANSSGRRTFNFNGGTLKAATNSAAFMSLGGGNAVANVRNGGAVIDDGGFAISIAQALVHSAIAGDNSTDGGLTKQGAGTATLSGANTYNGNTTVKAGTLELVQAALATSSTVSISNGAVLKLDFATTNRVSALVLNGASQSPGVYGSANASPYITGTGSLLVSPGPGTFSSTPVIKSLTISGANIILTGTNGQANDAYYLLTSTNVTLPKNQWRTVATNVLSANGSFTFTGTNVVTSGSHQQFYLLSNTNYNP